MPEQIKKLVIGEKLWPRERDLLLAILFNREKVIAFDFLYLGRIHEDVAPLQVIRTVEYKA